MATAHHPVARLLTDLDRDAAGRRMMELAARLFPLNRSITGDGLRRTLETLGERVPLTLHEVPTGTPVLDWTIPKEWNLRGARVIGPDGRRVVDLARSNLSVLQYSVPVQRTVSRAELDAHLYSLPQQPDLIPYRTSYYQETWGFCLPHRVREALPEGDYRVEIDATLAEGALSYGELVVPGRTSREVLVSCHVCHPSLANDNLSGLVVTLELAAALTALPAGALRCSYRFLWAPGTIGAIAWLAANRDCKSRIAAGLVAANLGDGGRFHYKRSRRGGAWIDRAVAHLLASSGEPYQVEDFVPMGYDERQYGSPGFDLPVGSLSRTPWGRYPEYHTSADDLTFIRAGALAGSLARYLEVVDLLEGDRVYRNLYPWGEPQLGRRGLYSSIGGGEDGRRRQLALLWVLNQADGSSSLLAIAERSGLPFAEVREAADALLAAGLLEEVADAEGAP
jgi:aminopeptidase-like protein